MDACKCRDFLEQVARARPDAVMSVRNMPHKVRVIIEVAEEFDGSSELLV